MEMIRTRKFFKEIVVVFTAQFGLQLSIGRYCAVR